MSRTIGLCAGALGCVLAFGATTASAVTLDITSPQAGTVLHPGDTIDVTVTVTNDTDKPDIIGLVLRHTLTVNGHTFLLGTANRVRFRLGAGQSVSNTLEFTVPTSFPTQFTDGILTIEGV